MTPRPEQVDALAALPCPFCGNEGTVVEIEGAWIAGCDAGQLRLDDDVTCRANAIGFYHATREGAVAAWNRRATAPDQPSPAVPAAGGSTASAERVASAVEYKSAVHLEYPSGNWAGIMDAELASILVPYWNAHADENQILVRGMDAPRTRRTP